MGARLNVKITNDCQFWFPSVSRVRSLFLAEKSLRGEEHRVIKPNLKTTDVKRWEFMAAWVIEKWKMICMEKAIALQCESFKSCCSGTSTLGHLL